MYSVALCSHIGVGGNHNFNVIFQEQRYNEIIPIILIVWVFLTSFCVLDKNTQCKHLLIVTIEAVPK